MREIFFYLAAAGAVFFSALMVFQRGLYSAAVCLLAALLQTAVLLYLAGSPLVGLLQVIICAGGVMVLVVVAIMSSSEPKAEPWARFGVPGLLAPGVVVLVLIELLLAVSGSSAPAGTAGAGLDARLGAVLFGPYAVATEAVAMLLFLAALAILMDEKGRTS
ncbi:MAG: NADH-quinone oxidoreductase subunit J [Elusimicrobia bacterium]|nr:NADH-quinone oxidoreductase subunit J [Elusimicrobiota bacterium]